MHNFHPPFNRISKYREPGKINLNTIYSSDVLDGLMNYFPGMTGSAGFSKKFAQSRQGYNQPTFTDQFSITSTCPTRFANPFRSFAGASMIPPVPGLGPQLNGNAEVEATLLRSDPSPPAPGTRPLFQYDATVANPPSAAYNDPDRNPYFRYQALTRLGNLVTTRSNVYAIWITVGYFEVTPWTVNNVPTVDAGHPDGYQLGAELDSDTGEFQRHRAFYIFDRTIPVGFQRGQDLNIEKGLLLRRYIE